MTAVGRPSPVTVFITVDTEEDDWGDFTARDPGVGNIARLPSFQALCERYGAVPTYLANWPVVDGDVSGGILRDLAHDGRCEIGTHIHPWNTPPVAEEPSPYYSMLCNLPGHLISEKLSVLHARIAESVGKAPVSFRAGRWGFGSDVAHVLANLGYRVDSSVSPLVDWTLEHGPDYRGAPAHAYRFEPDDPLRPASGGPLVEIPATIGFLRGRAHRRMLLREWAFRPVPRRLRMVGILDRLGLAALRWLSPEVATGPEMIRLARTLVAGGARFLNFTFHSPTLVPGLTPFVRSEADLQEFLGRIEQFFDFARSHGCRFASLGKGAEILGFDGHATRA